MVAFSRPADAAEKVLLAVTMQMRTEGNEGNEADHSLSQPFHRVTDRVTKR